MFGPTGSTWSGLGGSVLTNKSGGKNYFSVALLPDNKPETLALFQRDAHTNVFNQNGVKTYAAYHFGTNPLNVTFSDGTKLSAKPKSLTVQKANP